MKSIALLFLAIFFSFSSLAQQDESYYLDEPYYDEVETTQAAANVYQMKEEVREYLDEVEKVEELPAGEIQGHYDYGTNEFITEESEEFYY